MTAQTTPISRTLPLYVRSVIQQEINRLGKALPGIVQSVKGAIVTVNFQVSGLTLPTVEMPMFGPEYIRYPVQPGDKGVCFPADVFIGQMSGLGNGSADITQRGNLSTLVFFPVGNSNWSGVDPQSVTVYGPNGVVLRDTNSDAVLTLTPNGIKCTLGSNLLNLSSSEIELSAGGHTLVIDSSGITLDGLIFLEHTHTGVTTGTGVTGPVVP